MSMVFCRSCGKEIHETAPTCPSCGAPQATPTSLNGSEKRILPAFLLCLIFGWLGVHRFYVGKIGSGILQILTLGGLGIWVTIDLILIVISKFSDSKGRKLTADGGRSDSAPSHHIKEARSCVRDCGLLVFA